MRPPVALLVDDELARRASLRGALARAWPALQVLEAGGGQEALEQLETHRPDVAFLALQLEGQVGPEVARRLAGRCHLVFVTAYEEQALRALERAAADYLLEPVEDEQLAELVERVRGRLASPPPDLGALLAELAARRPGRDYLELLQAQDRQDLVLLAVDEVDLFQAFEERTRALAGEREWVVATPLLELEARLDPARFWRVSENAIVRARAVARVSRGGSGQLLVHLRGGGRPVPVSRARARRFRQG
jgi:DNA-binding LytR/AlgR family response regulator